MCSGFGAQSILKLCMHCKKHCLLCQFCAYPIFRRLFNYRPMLLTLRLVVCCCNVKMMVLYDLYHIILKP